MAKNGKGSIVNMQAFVSVVLAAVLLGFVAHETFHILTIQHPSKLTIHFGAGDFSVTTCCLVGNDDAMEGMAYALQFGAMIGWVWFNRKIFSPK